MQNAMKIAVGSCASASDLGCILYIVMTEAEIKVPRSHPFAMFRIYCI